MHRVGQPVYLHRVHGPGYAIQVLNDVGDVVGVLAEGLCALLAPLLDNGGVAVGNDPVVYKCAVESMFIAIVLAGPALPALDILQPYHMMPQRTTPLGYTMAHVFEICLRPQWMKEQLRALVWAEKAAPHYGESGDIFEDEVKKKGVSYYQVARGFLMMKTAPNAQWFAASFVRLKLEFVDILMAENKRKIPWCRPLAFTSGIGFAAGSDKKSMNVHLAVLDKAERFAMELARDEPPSSWTPGAPAPPDFFFNMAAKYVLDDQAPDGLGDVDDLAAYRQAKAAMELKLQAAQAEAAQAEAELAIIEQRLEAEAEQR
jgi:hypothetical protein